jgi:outer membrane protein OmpA-like peptidoglycan-associated protein
MSKISPLLFGTTAILVTSASVFGMSPRAALTPDSSFSVFFDPGVATLSKEGQEIVSVAAKRFAGTHSQHSAARISITSETDGQGNESLSNERTKAVGDQLIRDGVQKNFVSVGERPSDHAEPIRLLESLDRRVSIEIEENSVIGRL